MNRGNMGMQIATAPASPRPVRPMIAGPKPKPKPKPGGVRGMSDPKPAGILVSQPGGVRGMSDPKPAPMRMAKGGKAKKMDGCCMKGHTKGMMK